MMSTHSIYYLIITKSVYIHINNGKSNFESDLDFNDPSPREAIAASSI